MAEQLDTLLAIASERTGLSDFGPDTFHEGLAALIDALDREARLTEAGRQRLFTMIIGRLVNRLELEDWHHRHPEMADGAIREPWFIVGCWRSSTTALSYLLAQDPANRSLRRWEGARPCPPPGLDPAADAARLEQMRAAIAAQDQAAPELRKINLQEPEGPAECTIALSHEFKGPIWECFASVPSYGAYNRRADYASAYAYHRRTLQLLQWRAPAAERWQLKAPIHLLALEALLAEYPDARLIFTHRDPASCLASACSFWEVLMEMGTERIDPRAIGAEWTEMYDCALSRAVAFRGRHPEVPCVDIQQAEMLSDPLGTVARVYRELGTELSTTAEQRMRDFTAAHPRAAHGRHVYSAKRYGLDRDALHERFGAYLRRFDVPKEKRNE